MSLLLGVDFGTSYFKLGLFAADGTLRGLGRVAVPKNSPSEGRSELGVDDFWRALRVGLSDALIQASAKISEISAVSYSSQANTFLLLDRYDRPLTPLVIWNDQRAVGDSGAIVEFGLSESFARTVGFNGLSGEFAPAKWLWFQKHEFGIWRRTARVMTISDYFTHALTGDAVGDSSTAALLGVYSLADRGWWSEALKFFNVSPTLLSRPLTPGTLTGETNHRAFDLLGLPRGLKFAVGGLDHHMAAIGSGIDRLADASISTGTVLAALKLVDAIEPTSRCYHGPHFDGRQFYKLVFDPAGAAQLEEYRARHAPHLSLSNLDALAASIPFDYQLPRASDNNIRHAYAIRTLMEQISATHRRLLEQLCGAKQIRRVVATGGGSRSAPWLQIKANVLNSTIVTPANQERACLGAAVFAGVAASVYPTIVAALDAMVRPGEIILPQPDAVRFYQNRGG